MAAPPPPDPRAVQRMELMLSLRRRGIADQAVLAALDDVPRDLFVRDTDRRDAFTDQAMPISCGQTISQPFVVAYMTAALQVEPHHRVLEIGTGSGYQTAVLAKLALEIVSVERYRTLARAAAERLAELNLTNITIHLADGFAGFPARAPYDRILLTAAAAELPPALIAQLGEGGVLVAPVGGPGEVQTITRFTRTPGGDRIEKLIPVRFVPMLPGIADIL